MQYYSYKLISSTLMFIKSPTSMQVPFLYLPTISFSHCCKETFQHILESIFSHYFIIEL